MAGHYQGKFSQNGPKNHKKKKSKAGRILLILLAILLLVLLAAGAYFWYWWNGALNKMNHVELPAKTEESVPVDPGLEAFGVFDEETTAPAEATTEATTEPTTEATTEPTVPPMKASDIINVLVVGQSGRDGGEEALLADTMILLSMNTYTKTLTVTSILRDSFVKLPDYKGHECGRSKITFCYNLGYKWGGGIGGGMEMTNICLKDNFGIEVDHNVEINFWDFVDMIDYMGGLLIEINEAEANYLMNDPVYCQRELEPGRVRLNGLEALCFVRMRHAEGDNDSDIKRTERQRRAITAMINQFRDFSVPELMDLTSMLMPFITTTMDAGQINELLVKLLPMVIDLKIESGVCPNESWGDMVDIFSDGMQHSVLRFDTNAVTKHMREITEGEFIK